MTQTADTQLSYRQLHQTTFFRVLQMTQLLTKVSSNKDGLKNLNEHINNSVTSFKGDLGYRRTPHNESSQVGRQEKVLLSEGNNMKGDPGVVMNKKEKSSDNKQTKPLRKKLIKAGEF